MGDIGQPVSFHLVLSWAFLFASPHVVFMACSSEITPRCHEFFGLPLFLFPWGFHSKARFVMLLFAFLSVCPIHFHCLDLIVKALQFKYKICPQWLWNMERNSIFYRTTLKAFWTVASELSWEWGGQISSATKNYGERSITLTTKI